MVNASNADTAIQLLKDLTSLTYDQCQKLFAQGLVTFSFPLTSDALQIDVTAATSGALPLLTSTQTAWSATVTLSGADTYQTIKAGTAGKRLYVVGFYANTAATGHKTLSWDGGTTKAALAYWVNPVVNTNRPLIGNPLTVAPALGDTLTANGGANADIITAWGYEETPA